MSFKYNFVKINVNVRLSYLWSWSLAFLEVVILVALNFKLKLKFVNYLPIIVRLHDGVTCEDYTKLVDYTYNDCTEQAMAQMLIKTFQCLPPWFSQRRNFTENLCGDKDCK